MDDDEPTVRSRELGLALHRAMQVAGINQSTLAYKLEWTPSRVSRMLSGKRRVSLLDMSAALAVLGITGPKRRELLRLASDAAQPGWWQEYGDRLPAELCTLSDHENAAIGITNFEPSVIPGLLQTADYMSALMAARPPFRSGIGERIGLANVGRRCSNESTISDSSSTNTSCDGPVRAEIMSRPGTPSAEHVGATECGDTRHPRRVGFHAADSRSTSWSTPR